MAFQVGFLTELSSLQFAEDGEEMTSTFMAMPYGEYQHPVYGKITFDQSKAQMAAEHISKKSRGQDLDIDYDHKQYSGEAAGWVKAGEARPDGMYLTVSWTKKAWEAIKSKAYRYFSPEFADEWKHPKTQEVHKNILFGGGITNRPFLKDILPLNMSELSLAEGQEAKEGKGMDPKKLRKLLGLPEDATDEQVNAKLAELPDTAVVVPEAPKEPEAQVDPPEKVEKTDEPQTIAASEFVPAEVIKLTEGNPAAQALLPIIQKLGEGLTRTTAALQLSETANLVKKLSEPKNGRQVSAGTQKLLNDALLNPSVENIKKLAEGYEVVQLGEKGSAGDHGEADGDAAIKKFNDAVQAVMTQDKLDYGDAVDRVASTKPELFAEYRESSYAFKGN
jgi:hypothetical protein